MGRPDAEGDGGQSQSSQFLAIDVAEDDFAERMKQYKSCPSFVMPIGVRTRRGEGECVQLVITIGQRRLK